MDYNGEKENGLDEVDGPKEKPTSPTSFPSYLKQVAKRSLLGFERVHNELLGRNGDNHVQEEKKQAKGVTRRKKNRESKRRMGSIVQESFRSYVEPHDEPAVRYSVNTKRNLYSQSKIVFDNPRTDNLYGPFKTNNDTISKTNHNTIPNTYHEGSINTELNAKKDSAADDKKSMRSTFTSKNKPKVELTNKGAKTIEEEQDTLYDIPPSLEQDPMYVIPPYAIKASLKDNKSVPTEEPLYDVPPSALQDTLYDILPASVQKVIPAKEKQDSINKEEELDYIPMSSSSPRARIDSDERDYANIQEVIKLKKPVKAASFPGDYVNCAAEYKGNDPITKDIGQNKETVKESKNVKQKEQKVEAISDTNITTPEAHTFADGARYAVVDKHRRNKAKVRTETDKTVDNDQKNILTTNSINAASSCVNTVSVKPDKGDDLVYDYVDCEGMEDAPMPIPKPKDKPETLLKNGQTLRQRISQMNLDTTGEDSSYVVMLKQMGTSKHPEPKFYSLSVEEVVDVLNNCAMPHLAEICLLENLDGEYFSQLQMEDFCDEPFNMSWFYIGKLYRIINGWRPKRY